MDFDPGAVSKMSEKKMTAPGTSTVMLLSAPKLRAVIENARKILKIIEEFGSFDRYCWSFVNHKPIVSRFRYPRQVPVKTPKADTMSKDLVRRGFRCVGPTVIYSFMQVAGITNDHLINCYRFDECCAATIGVGPEEVNHKVKEKSNTITAEQVSVDLGLAGDINGIYLGFAGGTNGSTVS
uniref:Putative GMP synthase [glutamine-hydrolyzing] n=1 Tax=Anthurium amnicola TaxID=1678845 RepID=A0A1D1YNS2_9ARAE